MRLVKILIAFITTFATAVAGSAVTFPALRVWYDTLNKPGITPPNWIFGPVWTTLYVLMATAFSLYWLKTSVRAGSGRLGFVLYITQLGFNFLWSYTFFRLHSLTGSLFVIVILWVLIAATIMNFKKVSTISAWFMLPYLLWVSFATVLNLAFVLKN